MKDLMIDLETLGTANDAVVLSIGACFFDTEKLELGPEFYSRLEIDTQIISGRTTTPETLEWWGKQSKEAKRVFKEPAMDTVQALTNFYDWYIKNSAVTCYVWGNGSIFDIGIIEDLIKHCSLEVPWNYSNVMDLRTFRRFCADTNKVPRNGVHHNALDDARDQAKFVIDQLRKRK